MPIENIAAQPGGSDYRVKGALERREVSGLLSHISKSGPPNFLSIINGSLAAKARVRIMEVSSSHNSH